MIKRVKLKAKLDLKTTKIEEIVIFICPAYFSQGG